MLATSPSHSAIRSESRDDTTVWVLRGIRVALIAAVAVGAALWFNKNGSPATRLGGRITLGVSACLLGIISIASGCYDGLRAARGATDTRTPEQRVLDQAIASMYINILGFRGERYRLQGNDQDALDGHLAVMERYYEAYIRGRFGGAQGAIEADSLPAEPYQAAVAGATALFSPFPGVIPLGPVARRRVFAAAQVELRQRLRFPLLVLRTTG